ncbi:hypothetical protein PHLCEN_2v13274 [Hermanssonia centrifuga]|uniref:DNA repair metallo-beta-lactamase domain-containing protein n=1 Tax=Hermanssonia centrifuga TaxID=98765 RepID=A0A2R6NEQ0_9APHY|nr:hypothetical protein PHLCEN_2v13274 [Hermanssonia centrifuga]
MSATKWKEYVADTHARLQKGEQVDTLLVALSRHSPLPELQRFVSLFKPKRVVPNTLDPALGNLDWACIPSMFSGCLADGSPDGETVRPSTNLDLFGIMREVDLAQDTALKNLEGEGALELATRWADSGKSRRKLEILYQYLHGEERKVVGDALVGDEESVASFQSQIQDRQVSDKPASHDGRQQHVSDMSFRGKATMSQTDRAMTRLLSQRAVVPMRLQPDSDEDTEDEDDHDAHERTARFLFLGLSPESSNKALTNSSPIQNTSDTLQPSTSPWLSPRRITQVGSLFGRAMEGNAPAIPTTQTKDRPIPSTTPSFSLNLGTSRLSVPPMVDSLPRTPTRPATVSTLQSPIHLNSSSTERTTSAKSGKRQRAEDDEDIPRPLQDDDSIQTRTETTMRPYRPEFTHGAPLAELQNMRPMDEASMPTPNSSSKRRKVQKCSEGNVVSRDLYHDLPQEHMDDERRRGLRAERRLKAYRLRQAWEEGAVTSPTIHLPRGPCKTNTMPVRRPSTDILYEESVPPQSSHPTILVHDYTLMDLDRARTLRKSFEAQYSEGKRPGLVVPLLACLSTESQE